MKLIEMTLAVPYYCLKSENCLFGPQVESPEAGRECISLYGFSDKVNYDKFLKECDQGLTPYPLVKGYLRNQTALTGNSLNLVIIDAIGPHDALLNAASMESVLEAQEGRSTHVSAIYHLVFEPTTNTYRAENSFVKT